MDALANLAQQRRHDLHLTADAIRLERVARAATAATAPTGPHTNPEPKPQTLTVLAAERSVGDCDPEARAA